MTQGDYVMDNDGYDDDNLTLKTSVKIAVGALNVRSMVITDSVGSTERTTVVVQPISDRQRGQEVRAQLTQ